MRGQGPRKQSPPRRSQTILGGDVKASCALLEGLRIWRETSHTCKLMNRCVEDPSSGTVPRASLPGPVSAVRFLSPVLAVASFPCIDDMSFLLFPHPWCLVGTPGSRALA